MILRPVSGKLLKTNRLTRNSSAVHGLRHCVQFSAAKGFRVGMIDGIGSGHGLHICKQSHHGVHCDVKVRAYTLKR